MEPSSALRFRPVDFEYKKEYLFSYPWISGLFFGLTGCSKVKLEYTDRQESEADHLFSRGWLSKSIPVSSRGIVTTNDLNRNTSEGEFSFDRVHLRSLSSPENWVRFEKELKERG